MPMPSRPIVRAAPARLAEFGDAMERRLELCPAHAVRVLDRDLPFVQRERDMAPFARRAGGLGLHVLVDRIADVLFERVGRVAVQGPQPPERVRRMELDRDALRHGGPSVLPADAARPSAGPRASGDAGRLAGWVAAAPGRSEIPCGILYSRFANTE
jgi:hypothetical protein